MIGARTLITSTLVSAALMMFGWTTASADAVYHTARLPLQPAGAASGSGSVVNAHANGPQVYAHENYVLNGADPNTSYQVTLLIYPGDTSCSSAPLTVPSEIVQTNRAGNGQAKHVFSPADADGLRGATHGIQWQLTVGSEVAFETDCSSVTLD
jgi:hypothetical protein